MQMNIEDILARFDRVTAQFLSKEEFEAKLRSGRQLRIKYGIDIRTPELNIGHAVNLWLLRALQDAGHKAIIVFSDYTSYTGDTDGRLEAIAPLPAKEIEKNISDVTQQLKTILRFDANMVEIRRNSEWYAAMDVKEMITLFSLVTHARLVSRDDFQIRIDHGKEIHLNEMIYPLLNGYDSHMVKADIAVIGSSYLFEESLGRLIQEKHGEKPQTIIMTIMTPGIDGRHRQSHFRDNDLSLTHSPRDKFGRAMSIPDSLIEEYFRIYTEEPLNNIAELLKKNPRDAKFELAAALVRRYHGDDAARQEGDWFNNAISNGYLPDDMPELVLSTDDMETLDLVSAALPGKSRSECRRLIQQGGIQLNGRKLQRPEQELFLKTNDVMQAGKLKWFRLKIEEPPALGTDRLLLRAVHIKDISRLAEHIPHGDISKYIVRFSNKKKKEEADIRDAFKRIILHGAQTQEALWLIASKANPDNILGVAHLHPNAFGNPQNIWVSPEIVNEESVIHEAMLELSGHALFKLDPNSQAFKRAFEVVTAPKSLDNLYNSFRIMDTALLAKADLPQGTPGFTREGWEKMQEWRRVTSPWLFKEDPRVAFSKKFNISNKPENNA